MPGKTIHFTENNWTKLTEYKIKLMRKSVKSTISNSDAVNDIMENLK